MKHVNRHLLTVFVVSLIMFHTDLRAGSITIRYTKGKPAATIVRYYTEPIWRRSYEPELTEQKNEHIQQFTYPFINGYSYCSLSLFDSLERTYPWLFLLYPDDQVFIDMDGDHITYTGKGAERFRCQVKLYRMGYRIYAPKDPAFRLPPVARLYAELAKLDSLNVLRRKIIDSFVLTAQIKEQLYDEIITDAWWHFMGVYKQRLGSDRHGTDDSLPAFYRKELLGKLPLPPGCQRTARYADFLFQQTAADLMVTSFHPTDTRRYPGLGDMFQAIVPGNIDPPVKEKLLTVCAVELYKTSGLHDSLLSVILSRVTNRQLAGILSSMGRNLGQQQAAYDFSLPDERGRMVTLSAMKGKVVVLDFWFTGCSACVKLASAMQPIKERFRDDSTVVFVSVCTDNDKEMWQTSLHRGLYSYPGDCNLYTAGKGQEHPLIRHYNFIGYPQMLIVGKDGRLISTQVPRMTEKHALEELTDTILKARQ